MLLRTRTTKEKEQGKKIMKWSGPPALLLLFFILIVGFPSNLWTPNGVNDFRKGFLCALFFAATGIFLAGAEPLVEDWEVRKHLKTLKNDGVGDGAITNPLSGSLVIYAAAGVIACLVLFIRYLFLLYS